MSLPSKPHFWSVSCVWGHGTLLCVSAEHLFTALEICRPSYLTSLHLVVITKLQPSSLSAVKGFLFADINCVKRECEGVGGEAGNPAKEWPARHLIDQHPFSCLLGHDTSTDSRTCACSFPHCHHPSGPHPAAEPVMIPKLSLLPFSWLGGMCHFKLWMMVSPGMEGI